MPKLKKYSVAIPDYVDYSYLPDPGDREKALIYDNNCSIFYDKTFGYKKPEKEKAVEIF